MYSVKLNLKPDESSGLVFAGKPPRLVSYEAVRIKLPDGQPSIVDYYFEALEVPGTEFFHVSSDAQVNQLLLDFEAGARCVVLSSHIPPGHSLSEVDCMYKHDLPAHQPLGLTFEGFPPKLSKVEESSPLFRNGAKAGQYVEALLLPSGRPDLNKDTPGFTGSALQSQLETTNHLEGRKLVLKDLTAFGVRQKIKTKDDKRRSQSAPVDGADFKACCCM